MRVHPATLEVSSLCFFVNRRPTRQSCRSHWSRLNSITLPSSLDHNIMEDPGDLGSTVLIPFVNRWTNSDRDP